MGAPKRRFAADPQVAPRRDLEPSAEAHAVNLRDQRMSQSATLHQSVHDVPVGDRLHLVARSVANSPISLPARSLFARNRAG